MLYEVITRELLACLRFSRQPVIVFTRIYIPVGFVRQTLVRRSVHENAAFSVEVDQRSRLKPFEFFRYLAFEPEPSYNFV